MDELPLIEFTDGWRKYACRRYRSRQRLIAKHGGKNIVCRSCGNTHLTHKNSQKNVRCLQCELLVERAKAAVHNLVNQAIRQGKLLPAYVFKCVDCGRQAECHDHRDYRRPFDIDPVCRGCNVRRGPGAPFYFSPLPEPAVKTLAERHSRGGRGRPFTPNPE